MSNGLVPELVAAVKKEGIKLPEPKGATRSSSPSVVTESAIPTKPKISHFEVLTNAVETGDLDKVKEALRNGANPNGSVGVQNIVHLACEKGNIDIVRELLDHGAELNGRSSKWNDTPLHRACVFGHIAVVAELITRGATVNIRNSNCWKTPLENAITSKHFECCKLLVQAGAKVNEVNRNYGSTPLTEACHKGRAFSLKILYSFIPSLQGQSALDALHRQSPTRAGKPRFRCSLP